MALKPITKQEADKLNEALRTLHNFCASRFACEGCPFRKEGISIYVSPCKFGPFHPELWDDLEIKEEVQ